MKTKINLWIDDIRKPPNDGRLWTHAKNAEEAFYYMTKYDVQRISFDHDLCSEHYINKPSKEKNGYDILLWMIENNIKPEICSVHSANNEAKLKMICVLERYYNLPAAFFNKKYDFETRTLI